ncbi:MAG: 2-oxoglutarate dehydrogenase E1 subunit family protein, partial [Acidimicrobiia bacterium]
MAEQQQTPDLVGPNAWMVDEMYEQYLADPSSVSESWQDFFADYKRDVDAAEPAPARTATAPTNGNGATAAAAPASKPAPKPETADEPGEPIRGVGARIVENMEKSLGVPTATSFRNVPAKLLEV